MRHGGAEESKTYKATVHVDGCGRPIRVACGAGLQTVRWLAGVVAQRYAALPKSSGRMRHREATLGRPGKFIPMVVSTMDGDVLHPSSRLRDVFSFLDNELCMSLQKNVVLDHLGSMRRTAWASDAFVLSDVGRDRVTKKRDELARRAEAEKLRVAQEHEAKMAKEFGDCVNRLLTVDQDDPLALEKAMTDDWPDIRVERFTTDPKEIRSIKRCVLKHFVVASDLFKHYCGTVAGGDVATMCRVEFQHFLLNTHILHVSREASVIDRILKGVNAQRMVQNGNSTDIVTRFEFIEALIACAIYKYCSGPRPLRPPHAVRTLFEDAVEPASRRLSSGIVRAAMQTKEMVMAVRRAGPIMRRVFDKYKELDTDDTNPNHRFALNLKEFAQLLQDARLLEVKDKYDVASKEVSMSTARTIFSGVQLNEGDIARTASGRKLVEAEDNASEMVFSEFIEALARLGVERYPSPDWSVCDKFKKVVFSKLKRLDPEFEGSHSTVEPPKEVVVDGTVLHRQGRRRSLDMFSGGLKREPEVGGKTADGTGGGDGMVADGTAQESLFGSRPGTASSTATMATITLGPPPGFRRPKTPGGKSIRVSWD